MLLTNIEFKNEAYKTFDFLTVTGSRSGRILDLSSSQALQRM